MGIFAAVLQMCLARPDRARIFPGTYIPGRRVGGGVVPVTVMFVMLYCDVTLGLCYAGATNLSA